MARRKQNVFEDLVELAAGMPWWLGLLLALISYLVLHFFASEPPNAVRATNLDQMGQVAAVQLYRTLAAIGQYLVPFAFVIGAGVSAIGRMKRKALLEETAKSTASEPVKSLSWREFEMLVGEMFRNKGFSVTETAKGPDGGVDLELRKAGELSLVQCKQWRATKVGVSVVRELFGVMAARGAVSAYVVTSGTFTEEARKFSRGRNIILIDGKALEREIRRQAKSRSNITDIASARRERERPMQTVVVLDTPPDCPNCGASMVKRVAKQGSHAGKAFWGCSRFPKCRGTRALE